MLTMSRVTRLQVISAFIPMFPMLDADFVGPFALLQIVRTFFDAHYFIRC
jgi:hypothetical protein